MYRSQSDRERRKIVSENKATIGKLQAEFTKLQSANSVETDSDVRRRNAKRLRVIRNELKLLKAKHKVPANQIRRRKTSRKPIVPEIEVLSSVQ